MIDISKLERTKERNRLFIPEQYADALEWQLRKAGVTDFKIIHDRDERSESIPDRPKLIKANLDKEPYDPASLTDPSIDPKSIASDEIATVYSHFTDKDMIDNIIGNIFDTAWFEENNKRAKRNWTDHFGENEPCPI